MKLFTRAVQVLYIVAGALLIIMGVSMWISSTR